MANDLLSAQFQDKEIQKFLKSLSKNSEEVKKRAKKYVETISPIVLADIERHFNDAPKGASGGKNFGVDSAGNRISWDGWSKRYTILMKKIGKGGNRLLQDTSHMRKMLKPTNYRKSSSGILWYNNAKTESGFPYAAHFDETAQNPRPFMWLSKKAFDTLSVATLDFMLKIRGFV